MVEADIAITFGVNNTIDGEVVILLQIQNCDVRMPRPAAPAIPIEGERERR